MAVEKITANSSIVLSATETPGGFEGIGVQQDNYHMDEKDGEVYRITPFFIDCKKQLISSGNIKSEFSQS